MEYLLKSSGLVIILVVFYSLFLKNETFFTSIRSYFLIGIFIIIVTPLLEIPIYTLQEIPQTNQFNFASIDTNNQAIKNSLNLISIITNIYFLGVLFFSLKFVAHFISLIVLLTNHKTTIQSDLHFIETSKNIAPFSFFNRIIYNKEQFTIEELEQIIHHEKVHVKQWHSFDTILSHILVILLWFNPFAWYFKKITQQNLEFLADSCALSVSKNKKLYKFTLLKASAKHFNISLVNNFYNSLIKKRIIMLHKKQSQKKKQWKYALLIPVLLLFISTFNTKIIAQEVKEGILSKSKIELILNKNSTNENLEKFSNIFKKTFDIELTFNSIKRNSNNEITAIKIDAKNSSNSTLFMRQSDKPIKPILISYDSQKDDITIGNIQEKEEFHFTSKNNNSIIDTLKKSSTKIIWHKDKDTNLEVEVFDESKDELSKNHNIKINKAVFISDDGEANELILEEDNASENVYIIKKNNKNDEQNILSKKGEVKIIHTSNDKPIYIVNGEEINSEEIKNIDVNKIESINVLKGENAIKKYGEKGENGVIEMVLKKE
ncbi:M56 family metallopeptidase [Lutibacter sp.]|uniref:M56 family metallopeptidase n=1 Tax=Lutibacter sp. TaxID=1925666 RepID=UPI001A1FEA91|nr:M56 family metallopeptidase [Lutibacter sp.]MBI9041810.1 hypothetical protein [Lutibacter sp.]